MTPKQDKFCVEYLVDLNATQAAIRAGYSERTAHSQGPRLLENVEVQNRIQELRKKAFKETIATAEEVEAMLSKTMRGELDEEVVVVESRFGISKAKKIRKQVSLKDRIKAAELMGRRHQLFSDKNTVVDEVRPITFIFNREVTE
ncbi:terminase small subunit [uncultured Veillonella sp.]|uniref:terminase small subunit n=1 Tax=uncultured Veillonella sp. TaxID=159268 RepID=UPI0025FDD50B|nr:terminase small subunit [uncultured Veillonella sp.]